MKFENTKIAVSSLDKQDLCGEVVCEILYGLFDELTGNEELKVNNISEFKKKMSVLLERILGLYSDNEEALSKERMFELLNKKKIKIDNYTKQLNELQVEIEQADALEVQLKEVQAQYQQKLQEKEKIEAYSHEIDEELAKINMISLEELKQTLTIKKQSLSNLKQEQLEYQNKLDQTNQELQALTPEVAKIKKYVTDNQDALKQLKTLKNELAQEKAKVDELKQEQIKLEDLQGQLAAAKAEKEGLEKNIEKIEEKINCSKEQYQELLAMLKEKNKLVKQKLKDNDDQEINSLIYRKNKKWTSFSVFCSDFDSAIVQMEEWKLDIERNSEYYLKVASEILEIIAKRHIRVMATSDGEEDYE